jgi:hypothetical protein
MGCSIEGTFFNDLSFEINLNATFESGDRSYNNKFNSARK